MKNLLTLVLVVFSISVFAQNSSSILQSKKSLQEEVKSLKLENEQLKKEITVLISSIEREDAQRKIAVEKIEQYLSSLGKTHGENKNAVFMLNLVMNKDNKVFVQDNSVQCKTILGKVYTSNVTDKNFSFSNGEY